MKKHQGLICIPLGIENKVYKKITNYAALLKISNHLFKIRNLNSCSHKKRTASQFVNPLSVFALIYYALKTKLHTMLLKK